VDIWSCGVILFVMVTGKLPFDDENIPKLFKKITEGLFSLPSYLSSDLRFLLQSMLQVDPLKRITIQGIRDTPWFQKNLPDYLSPLPELQDPLQDSSSSIDTGLVTDLVRRMGISKDEVYMALGSPDKKSPIRVAYQLLADQRQRVWNTPGPVLGSSSKSGLSAPFMSPSLLSESPPSLLESSSRL